ncbi:MAG: metallopeptidase family protein [Ardenticatenia bacterium]|nr:metallopeptidase family protein [Ardenticatenia bacterium]
MNRDAFERIVEEAINALPDVFRQKLDNVEIVVEDWPDPHTMRVAGVRYPEQLLGLYHGVPQTVRSSHYGMVLPDKISIYRQPILKRCGSEEQVRQLTQHVIRHEIAHHFGIGDDRLREIEAY